MNRAILGIETSCDETACGIVSSTGTVLANVVASQIEEHRLFHGVVPEIASRAHAERVLPVIVQALDAARLAPEDIGVVAVTTGPGLIGPLLIGSAAAQGFAAARDIPLVPVNHVFAHLYGVAAELHVSFPFTGLVISGGHTALYRWLDGAAEPVLLGATADDAVGEAFDKVAKLLGLGHPGGPAIEEAARAGNPKKARFPKPGGQMDGLRFSFSGIKTAVLYRLKALKREPSAQEVSDIAAGFQKAVAAALAEKCRAALLFTGDRDFVVGGGVAANATVRAAIEETCAEMDINCWFPPQGLAGDNAVMVAHIGRFLYNMGQMVSARDYPVSAFARGKERQHRGCAR
jgi:N6-L-threonylcarbamoyladenine synthase